MAMPPLCRRRIAGRGEARRRWTARLAWGRGHGLGVAPANSAVAPECRLGYLADAGQQAKYARSFHRNDQHLLVRRLRQLAESFEIFLRHEVIQRGDVALRDRFADHLRRLGFGLCEPLARLGVAEGGLAAALGFENLGLLGALGFEDRGLPRPLGLEH